MNPVRDSDFLFLREMLIISFFAMLLLLSHCHLLCENNSYQSVFYDGKNVSFALCYCVLSILIKSVFASSLSVVKSTGS